MDIPLDIQIAGTAVNIHLILEYVAFFLAFRYYLFLRKHADDPIATGSRLSIILGAAIGAFVGSRLMGYLENPVSLSFAPQAIMTLMNVKTIMGGLFGGLVGVELIKKLIGETHSSGDLFTMPIILGIIIGRIGCFLEGVNEFTYGVETSFFMGMDLGDGLSRHPIALYEIIFLVLLWVVVYKLYKQGNWESGDIFKLFMLLYFAFRFLIEFIKPNIFYTLGLSSIQWLCIVCFVYYYSFILKGIQYAYTRLYVL